MTGDQQMQQKAMCLLQGCKENTITKWNLLLQVMMAVLGWRDNGTQKHRTTFFWRTQTHTHTHRRRISLMNVSTFAATVDNY